jgi:phenylacetic acid degradation protein
VVRELTEDELAWKANGTAVYQELARRSSATLEPCAPLRVADPGRRLTIDQDRGRPLREFRALRATERAARDTPGS